MAGTLILELCLAEAQEDIMSDARLATSSEVGLQRWSGSAAIAPRSAKRSLNWSKWKPRILLVAIGCAVGSMTTVDNFRGTIAAMDRKMLEHHLAQAQRHAAQGASLVAEQRERVAKLERLGADCVHAKRLLALFEELQAMHADDAERIRSKLSA